MYTHMMGQRRRAIGKGFWGDKLTQKKVEERQRVIREASKKVR